MKFLLTALAVIILAGCGSKSYLNNDSEIRARYHMELGDSLEAQNSLREAALEYSLVAELYPTTSEYASAVRKSAFLLSNPKNPARSDSASLYWFRRYISLPISREERAGVEVYVSMLERLSIQQSDIRSNELMIDSLQSSVRKQSADLSAKNRKIQDLEAELKRTTTELQNLRDVDVRINRRKGGK